MNVIVAAFAVLLLAAVARADTMMLGSAYGAAPAAAAAPASSSYSPATIPSPPCPRNYLFSCQPSLQPAPCAQPPPSYGSAGAYSENVPSYVAAPYGAQDWRPVQGVAGQDWRPVQGLAGQDWRPVQY